MTPVNRVLPAGYVDGILRTFDLFMAYSPGYFVVDIVARDLAGHNDTAIIGIYILRDDQRVKIVINEIPDRVRDFEEEFIRLLSNITGAIVNTDDVQVPRATRNSREEEGQSHWMVNRLMGCIIPDTMWAPALLGVAPIQKKKCRDYIWQ